LRGAEADILARVERDFKNPAQLNERVADEWRKIVEDFRNSADSGIRERAAKLAERLRARKKYIEAASALRDDFRNLAVTTTAWRHYDQGEDPWLIRVTESPEAKPLVIVVRAMEVFNSVQSDRVEADVPAVEFAFGGDADCKPLSDRFLPELCVNFSESSPVTAGGSGLLPVFFGLSLLLVMGLTLLAGYLVWRDTRREIRVSEMRSQFVSSVSHELKTPLTSIRMFAELLQIRGSEDARMLEEYLNTIVNESERLTRLLNNVLDFSKIEHGQKDYKLEPTRPRITEASAWKAKWARAAPFRSCFPLTREGHHESGTHCRRRSGHPSRLERQPAPGTPRRPHGQ
jgi:signal transduction histidine kinase